MKGNTRKDEIRDVSSRQHLGFEPVKEMIMETANEMVGTGVLFTRC